MMAYVVAISFELKRMNDRYEKNGDYNEHE